MSVCKHLVKFGALLLGAADAHIDVFRGNGPAAVPSYLNHYLIDNANCIILGVEATQARLRQETLAARRMLTKVKERFGICPEGVGADKAYGSGEFLAWLLERSIQPYIPVIDRRHQTHRRFTRDQFEYDPVENAFRCPQVKHCDTAEWTIKHKVIFIKPGNLSAEA